MTPEQCENLRKLTKKYNIFFDGPVSREQWPPTHAKLFQNIQSLGQTRYHEYKADTTKRSLNEPWVAQSTRRAERVVARAKRLRSENRNEAGWRLELEPEIFSRFTIEVACPNCRARIWRSEIEAFIDANDSAKPSIEDRRRRRERCRCPVESQQQDMYDPGLNPLFSDRAEEVVLHDDSIQPPLPKKEHPDRIYGLRETYTFGRTLSDLARSSNNRDASKIPVRQVVRSTPFRQDGDPLLYPFLILEAKSGKGQDSFDTIEKQTAFPIRTLLRLQEDLVQQCSNGPSWQDGPTVWFLSNKGEEWRVSAGFVNSCEKDSGYRIVDLWQGRMVSLDGALQLLLIMDHIFDWARDVYRPAILRHLKFLSEADCSDAMSMISDSDIFSLKGPELLCARSDFDIEEGIILSSNDRKLPNGYDLMRLLDSPKGVFRDAALVEYSFLSVTITADNVPCLLQSFNPRPATKLARTLLLALCFEGGAMIVDGRTLSSLGPDWTGEIRPADPFTSRRRFFTRLTYKTWLSEDWVITKELSCLSISEDAIAILQKESKRAKGLDIYGEEIDTVTLTGLVQPFKNSSSDYNLRAAVSRLALSSYNIWMPCGAVKDICSSHIDHRLRATPGKNVLEGLKVRLMKEVSKDLTQSLIDGIHIKHRLGRPYSPIPYFCKYHGVEFQVIDASESHDPYPLPVNQCLTSEGGHALVFTCGSDRTLLATGPEVCLFINSREEHSNKNLTALRRLVGGTLEKNLAHNVGIFSTTRYRSSKRPSAASWNSRYTRSIALGNNRLKIQGWIKHLRDEQGVDRFCKEANLLSPIVTAKRAFLAEDDSIGNKGSDNPKKKRAKTQSPNSRMNGLKLNESPSRYRIQLESRWVDQ